MYTHIPAKQHQLCVLFPIHNHSFPSVSVSENASQSLCVFGRVTYLVSCQEDSPLGVHLAWQAAGIQLGPEIRGVYRKHRCVV